MHSCLPRFRRVCVLAALGFGPWLMGLTHASSANTIQAEDVNGKSVAVNGTGHYTMVLYTNPDLEDQSRKMSLALDSYRDRSDFSFIRIVDLRGGVDPAMRGIVRTQIRKEQAKEAVRLAKRGIEDGNENAPIIPDFSGSTLDALGWDSVYDEVHLVIYDRGGHEIKRMENVSDPKQITRVVESIL